MAIVKRRVPRCTPTTAAMRYQGNLGARMTRDAQQLQHLANLPPDAHDWVDFVTGTLRLPGSYAPAAYKAISQNRWRRHIGAGQNPIGYVKTATVREALKMGLAINRYNPDEPRVPTKDRLVALPVPRSVDWASQKDRDAIYRDNEGSYQDHLDHLRIVAGEYDHQPDLERAIPAWLCLPDGYTIDWQKVARYAVPKLQMAPVIARVLTLRAEGWSRPRAIANAVSPQEGRSLKAAWRWIERNPSRIAHLFQLEKPPSTADVKEAGSKNCYVKFIGPGAALKAVLVRHKSQVTLEKAGPSIFVQCPPTPWPAGPLGTHRYAKTVA